MSIKAIVNFDNPRESRMFHEATRQLQGEHRVEIVKKREGRTLRQLRYYWPCFVQPFAEWMREEWGESGITDDDAHEKFKEMFLSRTIVNEKTGETLTIVRSTGDLTTLEFNQYLDACAQHLATYCNHVVPEPDIYHEVES